MNKIDLSKTFNIKNILNIIIYLIINVQTIGVNYID